VKIAVAFTQAATDEEGRPVRDPASSSYVATFAPAAAFGTLMAAEAQRRGASHIRQMVILGDGAAWIWNLAGQHFPQATQVVDLFHAREHLHDLARTLEFMLGHGKDDWLAARLAELDDGNIEAICAAARAFPLAGKKTTDLQTALGYFEHNAHRMCYAHFRKWAASRFPDSRIEAISCCELPVQVLVMGFLRSPVAECRMKTSPIIPELDVPRNIFSCLSSRRVNGAVNTLNFHGGIE